MLSERTITDPQNCNRSRAFRCWGGWLILLCASVSFAQEGTQNPLPKDTAQKKVEPPKVSEEDQVKLVTEGVPWFGSLEEQGEIRSEQNDPDEHNAYCYTLVHAHKQPLERLTKFAMKDVPFANLVEETPRRVFRYELIHFEGRLLQITRIPKVPQKVQASLPDLKEYYEGWLMPRDDPNNQPVCILFTELPQGMEVKQRTNYWVGFEGYYFKLLEYRAQELTPEGTNQRRRTPLLIGHSPRLMPAPRGDSNWTFGGTLVPAIVGLVALIIIVAFGLTYWFRKGDREVREHLATPKPNPFRNEPGGIEPGSGWNEMQK
jgi:hypothetical protein